MKTTFFGYSKKASYCKWEMCKQYDIMDFSFRVGVNTESPSEIGLFYLHHGSSFCYWKLVNSYEWSFLESTGNDFISFFVKKDITDFLIKKYSEPVVTNKHIKENDAYTKEILSILRNRDSAVTISDAQKYLNVTRQKATVILKKMELNGMVYKNRTVTGMIYFTLAE